MKKHLRAIVATALVIFLFSTPLMAKEKVLFIPKGTMMCYWQKVTEGALKAGDELNIEMTVRGPRNENHHRAQIKIIEFGIEENYDAIVLAPNHEHIVVPVVKKAVDRGIKVILIDSNMSGHYHSSFVVSDNYAAGQQAADHAAGLIGQKGTVALVRFAENNTSTADRGHGFIDKLKSHYPQIKVIVSPYAGATTGSAYHTVSALIEEHPAVDLIFSINETTTFGTLRILKEKNLHQKIKHIGFDFNETVKDAVLNHEIDAAIAQNPYEIGYLGVNIAHQRVQGETVPKKLFTETVLINAENFNTARVQNIIKQNLCGN
jgi:ribose transport system substrate-binding protein